MNHTFYEAVLTGDPSQVFNDQDNVIWIDWGDEEDAIVDAIRSRIGLEALLAQVERSDNEHGYVVVVSRDGESITVDPSADFDSRHATLNAVDALLADHQIRFAAATNGSDTIAVAIERKSDWEALYREFGATLDRNFCPIREIPDLMNTPGNEIDEACESYANRLR